MIRINSTIDADGIKVLPEELEKAFHAKARSIAREKLAQIISEESERCATAKVEEFERSKKSYWGIDSISKQIATEFETRLRSVIVDKLTSDEELSKRFDQVLEAVRTVALEKVDRVMSELEQKVDERLKNYIEQSLLSVLVKRSNDV